jgi:hypothetical protein
MRRAVRLLVLLLLAVAVGAGTSATAQASERIRAYDVDITIEPDGALRIRERIEYDFGGSQGRHGIYRDIPTRLAYDTAYDRVYPLEVVSVTSATAPDGYELLSEPGGITRIRIGDPDRTVEGRHSYELVYRIRGGLNGFAEHDELYWDAIGDDWSVPTGNATVRVAAPGAAERVLCFAGPTGSTDPCDRARVKGGAAVFGQEQLAPYSALTIVVAIPKGLVPAPEPILEERLTPANAFRVNARTGGAAAALLLLIVPIGLKLWRGGRDVRFRGSAIDQVMGGEPGNEQRVPAFEADAEAPVEFAPPAGLRPGQIGTLIDERANTLDVTATIVDLAVGGHLVIEEVPKDGLFGKADWRLTRLDRSDDGLLGYERTLLASLFRDGSEVLLSDLRKAFHTRLAVVQDAMYRDAMGQGWFRDRPDKVRSRWQAIGAVATAAAIGATVFLGSRKLGLLGIPLLVAGLTLLIGAGRMPARTATGTALLRRIRGFRRVIETAETHMARWAEEEQVFTRYLPFAIVFGCTERWAKTFEGLADAPAEQTWYVAHRPLAYRDLGRAMDDFTVTTSGTIASTPSGSGSSGFGGGGSSGGGGGGGGGGSW